MGTTLAQPNRSAGPAAIPGASASRPTREARPESPGEQTANAATHALGALLAVAATVVLVTRAAATGDPWRIVSFAVFGLSAVVLYLASTLYHSYRATGHRAAARRETLKLVDHLAIYLLIAGTYTPFTLVAARGPVGWTLFGVIWGLAAVGIVIKLFTLGRARVLGTLFYIAMGWTVLGAISPLVRAVPMPTLVWLAAGGVSYTAGTAFFLARRLPYRHAIWHLFVLGGTAAHVVAVMGL